VAVAVELKPLCARTDGYAIALAAVMLSARASTTGLARVQHTVLIQVCGSLGDLTYVESVVEITVEGIASARRQRRPHQTLVQSTVAVAISCAEFLDFAPV